jgi:hypothetical protein
MAKPNYSYAKRQQELAKKKKKEEKRQRKLIQKDKASAVDGPEIDAHESRETVAETDNNEESQRPHATPLEQKDGEK